MKNAFRRLFVRQAARQAAPRWGAIAEALEGRALLSTSVGPLDLDFSPPLAVVEPASPANRGDIEFFFTVDYTDDVAVDVGTLSNANLIVTGPNSFAQQAVLVTDTSTLVNAPTVAVVYAIDGPVPDGFLDGDAGTYTVEVPDNGALADTSQNGVPSGTIGTFDLSFAQSTVGPDLALKNVTYAAGEYTDGSSILVQAAVQNVGTKATGGFDFVVRLTSGQDISPVELGSLTLTQSLAPGESMPVTFNAQIPGGTAPGPFFLTAEIATTRLNDVDSSNNFFEPPTPDVTIVPRQESTAMIGGLDQSFGFGGIIKQDTQLETTVASTIQPDGKTLTIGLADGTSTEDFAITRLNADGSQDLTFGGPSLGGPIDGTVFTDFSGRDDTPAAIELQPDGKILVLGTTRTAGGTADADIAIVRYNADGSLDTTFGTGGLVQTSIGPAGVVTTDIGKGLWLTEDGRFLVCAQSNAAGNGTDFAALRYTAAGVLDTSFNGGIVLIDFNGGNDTANALAVDPKKGTIVAVGSTTASGTGQTSFAVARFTSAGILDSKFGAGGKIITAIGKVDDEAFAVAIGVKSEVVVAGATANDAGTSTDFAVVRYTSRGVLDAKFGVNGIATISFNQPAVANQVVLDEQGNVFVSGGTVSSLDSIDPSLVSVALGQLLSNGQADPKFGTPGIGAGTTILNLDSGTATAVPGLHEATMSRLAIVPQDSVSQQAQAALAKQHAIAKALGGQLIIVASAGEQTAVGHVVGSAADLTTTMLAILPDPTVSGTSRGTATISISNNGNRDTAGTATITLLVSLDPTAGAGDVQLATLGTKKIKLKPAQMKNFKSKFVIPANLVSGNYFIIARVDAVLPQISTDNDSASSLMQTPIAAPLIDFAGAPLVSPPPLAVGGKTTLAVTLTNNGNVLAKGTIEIKVLAAAAATPAGGDAVLADIPALKVNIKPGASKTFKVKAVVPAGLAPGNYFLLATLTNGLALGDPTPANNLLAAPTPLVIS